MTIIANMSLANGGLKSCMVALNNDPLFLSKLLSSLLEGTKCRICVLKQNTDYI